MDGFAPDWVAFHVGERPDAVALADADTGLSYTWARLDERVDRLTSVLATRFGVGAGDRVALLAENDPRVFEAQFACMRMGAILVPLNWRLTAHELAEICRDCTPTVLLHDGTWAEVAAEIAAGVSLAGTLAWTDAGASDYESALAAAEAHPGWPASGWDDTTHILYTSGTTGRPKGARSTHRSVVFQTVNASHAIGVAAGGCHVLSPMPLFHAGGLHSMANPVLYYGGRVTTMRRFDPGPVLELMAGGSVTHYAGIPMMYQAIADLPDFASADLSGLREVLVAGAVPTPELLAVWSDRGTPLGPQYGATETGPMVLGLSPHRQDKAVAGSCGRVAFHTRVRLVDPDGRDVPVGEVGELWAQGPNITPGYWGKDGAEHRAEFFTDGWYRTGDAAKRDAEGFYYIAGRTKEMYKSGGENVYPAEVENVLSLAPGVADLAVVGIPDPTWQEVGLAIVVAEPGAHVTLDQLVGFGTGRLARYKLPKRLAVVDELPRNVTGKVDRSALRARYG